MLSCAFTLVINTSQDFCSVAYYCNGRSGAYHERMMRGQSEALVPAVHDLLMEGGVVISDVNRIIVVRGPGTYAGIRIGLAAGYGLAAPWGIPLYGITSLDAARIALLDKSGVQEEDYSDAIVVLLNGNSMYIEAFREGVSVLSPYAIKSSDSLEAEIDRVKGLYSIKTVLYIKGSEIEMPCDSNIYISYPSLEGLAKRFSFMDTERLACYNILTPCYAEP